jgi:hypothetical protein
LRPRASSRANTARLTQPTIRRASPLSLGQSLADRQRGSKVHEPEAPARRRWILLSCQNGQHFWMALIVLAIVNGGLDPPWALAGHLQAEWRALQGERQQQIVVGTADGETIVQAGLSDVVDPGVALVGGHPRLSHCIENELVLIL